MKNYLTTLLYILFTTSFAGAQSYIHEFGKFSSEDFQLKAYDKDPTAEAVVIYDIGESYFSQNDQGFEVIFERRMKIKVFTKAGIKSAQISIPFYVEGNNAEKIYELKGNTYNFENGKVRITPLDLNNTYSEKFNKNWSDKKFAMPDVKEGSVFEVSYKIRSPYLFNLRSWSFQREIPIIHSEYTTKMIPFYEYIYSLQGTDRFDNYKSYDVTSVSSPWQSIQYRDLAHNFIMKNMPAFKDESFITSPNDYLTKINFQLAAIHYPSGQERKILTTWAELSKEMADNTEFGKYMNSSKKKTEDLIETMQLSDKSPLEKAKQIERYVKTNFNWKHESDKYATQSVKDFLTSKTGNCADINLFLAGMLSAAGIEAYPVLISTRDHGKININYPFFHLFNYIIVLAKIDNVSFLLDATEPLSNFNEIPSRCINEKGLIIQKDKVEWINLKSNSVSTENYNFNLALTPENDSIRQECIITTTGYDAIDFRKKFSNSYKVLKSELLGSDALPEDTISALNLSEIENPFRVKFTKRALTESIEDKLLITPFCHFAISDNPLKQPTRNYPVDIIYKKSYNFQSTITIPKGYKLLSKPMGVTINNPLMKITYKADTQINGLVNIMAKYEFNKEVYGVADYAELKKCFNVIVDKFNEKLIFIKEV